MGKKFNNLTVHRLPVSNEVNLDLTQRQNIQLKFSSYLWCTFIVKFILIPVISPLGHDLNYGKYSV